MLPVRTLRRLAGGLALVCFASAPLQAADMARDFHRQLARQVQEADPEEAARLRDLLESGALTQVLASWEDFREERLAASVTAMVDTDAPRAPGAASSWPTEPCQVRDSDNLRFYQCGNHTIARSVRPGMHSSWPPGVSHEDRRRIIAELEQLPGLEGRNFYLAASKRPLRHRLRKRNVFRLVIGAWDDANPPPPEAHDDAYTVEVDLDNDRMSEAKLWGPMERFGASVQEGASFLGRVGMTILALPWLYRYVRVMAG